MFGLAAAVDLIIGGQRFLGRLPGPDDAFAGLAAFLTGRLNRPQRSARERWIRGLVVLLPLIPLFAWLGYLANGLTASGRIGFGAAFLYLLMSIRQRRYWEAAIAVSAATQEADKKADRFTPARRAIEQIIFRFADNLVANLILFVLGGFMLLLPYRLVAAFIAAGNAPGTGRPEGAFFAPPSLLYNLLSLPGALVSGFLVWFAHLLVPRSNMASLVGLFTPMRGRLPVRLMPLAVLAHGLNLAFESRRQNKTGATIWIGPKDGRARVTGSDVRQACRLLMAAGGLLVILVLMLASFFLTEPF